MMKNILIFLAVFPLINLYGQDDSRQNPNVELPDFVITGQDDISVQKAKKIAPEYISTVSQDFLKPAFSPEQLEMRDLSNPMKSEIQLFDSLSYMKGNLEVGIGAYTIPRGLFTYSQPFTNGVFEGYANALNRRAHVDYSDLYNVNGGVNLVYQLNREAAFLPGNRLKLHADYGVSAYRFYGAPVPSEKRTHSAGNLSAGINNFQSRTFIYGLNFSTDFISVSEENFSDRIFDAGFFGKYRLPNFHIGLNFDYKNNSLENDSVGSASYNFINLRPTIGLHISKGLKSVFGISYAKSGDSKSLMPYASLGLSVDDGLSLFAEYSPAAELLNMGHFLNENPYVNLQNYSGLFFKKTGSLNLALKYEYFHYFEIDAGAKYVSSDDYPFFQPSLAEGRFDVRTTEAVLFSGYLNMLFHLGPYGIFYGTVELNDLRDSAKNFLPYSPEIKSSLNYGYDFAGGFSITSSLLYTSGVFTNIENTESLDDFIDLRFKLAYKFSKQLNLFLELNNILSRDNFLWRGYKETPLDVVAGFNFKW
jgi:hypothetical protein